MQYVALLIAENIEKFNNEVAANLTKLLHIGSLHN